eukprot:scaffold278962_cov22-Tisochrysis_lutea.AAC.1
MVSFCAALMNAHTRSSGADCSSPLIASKPVGCSQGPGSKAHNKAEIHNSAHKADHKAHNKAEILKAKTLNAVTLKAEALKAEAH